MLSKDFRIWLESFERGWVKRITYMGCSVMAAGVSLSKRKDKSYPSGAVGKAVNGGLHGGFSPPSGNWTGCLRSVLLPALFCGHC